MEVQLSWFEHTPAKGEGAGTSPFISSKLWGRSSIYRAPDLHSGGRGFDLRHLVLRAKELVSSVVFLRPLGPPT